jgi:hypothetical protein
MGSVADIISVLRRAVIIVASYLIAVAAGIGAPIFLILLMMGGPYALLSGLQLALTMAAFMGTVCALPALPIVVYAEIYRRRDQSFYVVAASSVGCSLIPIMGLLLSPRRWLDFFSFVLPIVPIVIVFSFAFGSVVGTIYWYLAGRSAGQLHSLKSRQENHRR